MVVSVGIATIVGILAAWAGWTLQAGGRNHRRAATLFFITMVAAAVMPMILHAAAWEATAGKFGWWMLTQTGARTDAGGSYGFFAGLFASAWIHGLVGASIVTIATWYGAGRVSMTVIEQSQLDFNANAIFWRVRLPIAAPWCFASVLATATLTATEMTVVDLYGYRTLADEFYLFYATDATISSILLVCSLPLLIGLGSFTYLVSCRRRHSPIRTQVFADHVIVEDASKLHGWVAGLTALAIASMVILVPTFGLLVKVGQDVLIENGDVVLSWSFQTAIKRLIDAPMLFATEFRWSAILAAFTATTSILIAWPIAAIGRTHRRIEIMIDLVSIGMICLPGPVIGLAVVSMFQLPIPGFQKLYQETLFPTVLALSFRAVPMSYWMLRSGYRGIDAMLLDAAATDFTWWRRMFVIDRPILAPVLATAWTATALVSSGDVPAMLPVLPAGVTTVGVRLFGLLHSGARYQEASLAITYVAAMTVIAMVCLKPTVVRRAKMTRPKSPVHDSTLDD